jgi:hypothetical protein
MTILSGVQTLQSYTIHIRTRAVLAFPTCIHYLPFFCSHQPQVPGAMVGWQAKQVSMRLCLERLAMQTKSGSHHALLMLTTRARHPTLTHIRILEQEMDFLALRRAV